MPPNSVTPYHAISQIRPYCLGLNRWLLRACLRHGWPANADRGPLSATWLFVKRRPA
ncbi:hypothetical protein RB4639 [Rhodopirellula baltica SH 1]|uniref:Uncharacterized protein n=1 Tax=Rhodopirellula baltica (strain DSM 10527 / NCIMB 13988 / SH1) TaxID=243090 RepID=Q7US95_RHOBA|nr:hypothetical protein RB4639 [Rhodopirellula baltica SH 1]